jgi:hypothetical protein
MIAKLFYLILILFSSPVFAVYLTDSSEARGIAIATMNQQYGKENYREKYDCWLLKDEEENLHCLAVQRADTISDGDSFRLFILVSSITDYDSSEINYSNADTGVLAAFLLEKEEDGSWSHKATTKIISSHGEAGYTGASDAKFVELGINYYGWIFEQGTATQGYSKYNFVILAPKDNEFVNLNSNLPASCGEPSPQAQPVYKIEIVQNNKKAQIYLIKLKEYRGNKMTNSYMVGFDYKKWQYNPISAYCSSFEF